MTPGAIHFGPYMNASEFARLSIHVGSKIKIASVYPDFDCSFGLLSLMELAC